ncbi:hypothetical protein AB0284_21410 [Pseudarthrobacter phenanthrenivorans]|uniref:hypothetical protein n=1 Tax=Pseudarthrobacter phenanthrenivorans TaxID=361575 RepID=UPI00344C78DD
MTECTTKDCRLETATYLCTRCVEDLQAWIDKVPPLRAELFTTMARLDKIAPAGNGGGGSIEAPMPLREGAMELRAALAIWEGQDAAKLAEDAHADGYLQMLKGIIDRAEQAIDIPDELFTHGQCGAELEDGTICTATLAAPPETVWVNCPECETPVNVVKRRQDLNRKAVQALGGPVPPREAMELVKEKTGANIKAKDFENWVKLGHLPYVLDHVSTTSKPRRIYFPGELFKTFDTMREKRRQNA